MTNETPEDPNIRIAQQGADAYYRDAAKEIVAQMKDEMSITAVIRDYCNDPDTAQTVVDGFVNDLPTNDEKVMRAFILYELLISTREELADIVGQDMRELDEAARSRQNKTVDDKAIRESAGYSDKIDEEVADSHKTDRAQELNITDDDVADSASEGVTYQDKTAMNSPLIAFLKSTRNLAHGIVDHCLQNDDVQLLIDAEVVDISPKQLVWDIKRLTGRLEPPRDEDK